VEIANTLAYYFLVVITTAKCFITQGPPMCTCDIDCKRLSMAKVTHNDKRASLLPFCIIYHGKTFYSMRLRAWKERDNFLTKKKHLLWNKIWENTIITFTTVIYPLTSKY